MRHTTALLFLIVAPLLSRGAVPTENKRTASFRFVSLASPGNLCLKVSKEKYERVNIGVGFIGAPVRLPLSPSLELLRNDAPGINDPLKPGEIVGTFRPADAPRQLVILLPGANKTLIGHAMPDTVAGIPYGRIVALNLTKTAVVFSLNDEKVAIPARSTVRCPKPKETQPADRDIRVRLITNDGNGERTVYSSVWPAGGPLVRTLVFIIEGPDGLIEVRPVTDVDAPSLHEAPDKNAKDSGKKTAPAAAPTKSR